MKKPKYKIGDVVIVVFDLSVISQSASELSSQAVVQSAYFENNVWKYDVSTPMFGGIQGSALTEKQIRSINK